MLASGEGFLRTLIGWDKVLQFAESFLAMASFASPKCCPSLACSASCLDRKEDTRITVYHLSLKSCLNVDALMCVFMCICVFFPQHESKQLYSSPFPIIHWFTMIHWNSLLAISWYFMSQAILPGFSQRGAVHFIALRKSRSTWMHRGSICQQICDRDQLLPVWSASCLISFLFDQLPVWSASCLISFLFAQIALFWNEHDEHALHCCMTSAMWWTLPKRSKTLGQGATATAAPGPQDRLRGPHGGAKAAPTKARDRNTRAARVSRVARRPSILSNCQGSTLQVVQKHPNPLLLRDLETCDLIIRAGDKTSKTTADRKTPKEKHSNVNSTRITISITSLVQPESCNLFHLWSALSSSRTLNICFSDHFWGKRPPHLCLWSPVLVRHCNVVLASYVLVGLPGIHLARSLVADFEASEETDAQERNGQEFEPTIQTQSDGDAVAFFKLWRHDDANVIDS